MASESAENYLKTIYKLQRGSEAVSTSSLAERMAVSAPSATRMMQHMQAEGLVDYTSHRGVTLTPQGRGRAMQVIRRHRLIELFLVEVLGYSWDEIDDEAERLEHAVSELFEQRVAALLSDPHFCPHGDPIPDEAGRIFDVRYTPLTEAPMETDLVIRRVSDQRAELLRQLAELGLRPGARLRLERSEESRVLVRVEGERMVVAGDLAARVFVSEVL